MADTARRVCPANKEFSDYGKDVFKCALLAALFHEFSHIANGHLRSAIAEWPLAIEKDADLFAMQHLLGLLMGALVRPRS